MVRIFLQRSPNKHIADFIIALTSLLGLAMTLPNCDSTIVRDVTEPDTCSCKANVRAIVAVTSP